MFPFGVAGKNHLLSQFMDALRETDGGTGWIPILDLLTEPRFGSFGSDAHQLFGSRAGLVIWLPRVLAAMDAAGLPVQVLHTVAAADDTARPPPSGFAALADTTRLPVKTDRARDGYRTWLAASAPRAFAVQASSGAWGSAWGGEQPLARALANCTRNASTSPSPCKLYAVDDSVVWTPD